MPKTEHKSAKSGTLQEAYETIIQGLPTGLSLSERLPIFYLKFDAPQSDLVNQNRRVSRETLRLWESGEVTPSETKLRDLERSAKECLRSKGIRAGPAGKAAKWLAYGEHPTKKAPVEPEGTTEALASQSFQRESQETLSRRWTLGETEQLFHRTERALVGAFSKESLKRATVTETLQALVGQGKQDLAELWVRLAELHKDLKPDAETDTTFDVWQCLWGSQEAESLLTDHFQGLSTEGLRAAYEASLADRIFAKPGSIKMPMAIARVKLLGRLVKERGTTFCDAV